MPGTILIVDHVAINRIVLKVRLASAFYDVIQATSTDEAQRCLEGRTADLVLIGDSLASDQAIGLVRRLRARSGGTLTPIVLIRAEHNDATRHAALEAGASDVLLKPVADSILLARLRNLMRRSELNRAQDLRVGGIETQDMRATGCAEAAPVFETPPQVALVSARPTRELSALRRMRAGLPRRISMRTPAEVLASDAPDWDVLVLELPSPADQSHLALLSELRARAASASAGIIVVVPDDRAELISAAYDTGASDVIPETADPRELALRIRALARHKRHADQLRDQLRDGLRASVIDPLTGLYNRRFALPYLDARLAEMSRGTGHCAVMVADVDHFKTVNDRFGHAVGDQVLCEIAERLVRAAAPGALVARTGGEEFLIVLPDVRPPRALEMADKLCAAVRATPVRIRGGQSLEVTVSVGVSLPSADDPDLQASCVIDRADQAMYAAKSHGRNRVSCLRSAA